VLCYRRLVDSGLESVDFDSAFRDASRYWYKDRKLHECMDAHVAYLSTMSAYRTYLAKNQIDMWSDDDPLQVFKEAASRLFAIKRLESVEIEYPYYIILCRKL